MIGLIHHTPTRRALLAMTAAVFAGLALQTLRRPDLVALAVGNGLRSANDYSELHAIYASLWLVRPKSRHAQEIGRPSTPGGI